MIGPNIYPTCPYCGHAPHVGIKCCSPMAVSSYPILLKACGCVVTVRTGLSANTRMPGK